MVQIRCHRVRFRMPAIRNAFDWSAYGNRSSSLKLLRRNQIHVDTTIRTRDGFVDSIHWQAITALCPKLLKASKIYFETKQSDGRLERIRHVELPESVDSNLARNLVSSAYGENVVLDRYELVKFYRLAEVFEIEHAIKLCLNSARSLLDPLNCIQMLILSLKHRHHSLRRASYSLIRTNFKLVLRVNQDFHLLPPEYLRHLLLDDYLKLNEDEELAWIAIVRWFYEKPISETEMASLYNEMVAAPNHNQANDNNNINWLPNQQRQQASLFRMANSQSQLQTSATSTGRLFGHPILSSLRTHLSFNFKLNPLIDTAGSIIAINNEPIAIWTRDDKTKAFRDRTESHLVELIKCLRFLRFRSLNAFNVIERASFVKESEKMRSLIINMKVRYLIRKKLPVNRYQLEQLLGAENLAKIKKNESTRTKRMVHKLRKLLKPPDFVLAAYQQPVANQNDTTQIPFDQPIQVAMEVEKEEADSTKKRMSAQELDEISLDCLRRSERPRIPNSVAFLIGGWQDGAVSKNLMAYDFVCDQWFKLNIHLPEPRAFHVSCSSSTGSQIFIMGGTNGEQILNSVLRFDPNSDVLMGKLKSGSLDGNQSATIRQLEYKFHKLCPMRERRCHLSGVFHSDGRVYALGGHDGQQRLRTAEWYDSQSNQWHEIAEMTIARSDASACSHDSKIFIAGGQIGDQFIQSSVEFYKPSDNTWTFAAPMIVPRMSFQLVSYRAQLMAIGGIIGLMAGDEVASMTRSVERYNPQLASWTLCAPMNQKRSSFGVINIDDKIIVIGGHGGNGRLKSCEQLKMAQFRDSQVITNNSQTAGATSMLRATSDPSMALRNDATGRQRRQQQQQQQVAEGGGGGGAESRLTNAHSEARINQMFGLRGAMPIRTAMKWVDRAKLPAKRTGFSVCVVQIKNAKEFTYHGSLIDSSHCHRATIVKQKGRWHKFKIIKRRKLIKHLKIALVITVVILIM